MRKMKCGTRAGRILAIGALSAVMAGLSPVPHAYAETSAEMSSKLDVARSQLEQTYAAAEQAGYDLMASTQNLDATNASISQLQDDIAQKQEKLSTAQAQLSDMTSAQYKGGGANLVSIVLGSDSIEQFVSRVHYANRVSESQQQAITDVRTIKSSLEDQETQLEQQRSEQEKLVQDQQQKKQAADDTSAAAQSYYDHLDDQVKQQLAAEQATAAIESQKAAEAAAAQAATASAAQDTSSASAANSDSSSSNSSAASSSQTRSSDDSSSQQSSSSSSSHARPGHSSSSSSSSNNNSSSVNVPASGMLERANLIIGSGYSYSGYRWTGSTSTSYFTCSGVVDFALGYPSQSNWPESYYGKVHNLTKDISALSPGDLVFFTYAGRAPGHVGIYIGNGQMIDSSPDGGVQVRSVRPGNFMGGGSL